MPQGEKVFDQEKNSSNEEEIFDKGPSFGARHVQALLLFFGVTIEIMTRTNLSLSIVAMTDNSTNSNPNIPVYDWQNTNVILSSFYWGYIMLQIPAGQLAKTYGARWILFGAMSINAFATAMIPFSAKVFGSSGVMGCRVLQGLSQGGIFPSCHTMLGRWAPVSERGRMSTFVYSGISLGTIIALVVTGIISESSYGWPMSFYLFGALAFVWANLWFIFGHSTPAAHTSISPEERTYIEISLNQQETRVIPTPWTEMFTSLPFWAMVVPTVFSGFAVTFMQNEIPTYLEKVLKYNIASSGYLTALTPVVGMIATYFYGPLSDFLIERGYLSTLHTRKLMEALSNYGAGAALIWLAFLDETHTHLSVVLFMVTSVFAAGLLFGHGVNCIDMSPRFSGIILGFANATSCICALSAPLSVQYLVPDLSNTLQWRWVLLLVAGSFAVPATFFVLFASADRQSWDEGPKTFRNALEKADEQATDR